jgi:hypothetical protein
MAFAIIESYRELQYTFCNTYKPYQCELRDLGNQQLGFTDADIVEIVNHVEGPLRGELEFYKERLYHAPSTIIFTIFNVIQNEVVCEMHVKLAEKRAFFVGSNKGWIYPNMTVHLKITQNPNLKTYVWTGIYS